MIKSIDKYVDEYISLSSCLCHSASDYTKEKVTKNNAAMKSLKALKADICKDTEVANSVYQELLDSQNIYIQQSAATDCLKLNIHIDISVNILRKMCRSKDRMIAMSAKRTLLIWEGKIDSNDPF